PHPATKPTPSSHSCLTRTRPPTTPTHFPYTTLFRSGNASISTFNPTASAVFGLTPGPTPPSLAPSIACWRCRVPPHQAIEGAKLDRKSTRLNSSHQIISYAVFCLKKKKNN